MTRAPRRPQAAASNRERQRPEQSPPAHRSDHDSSGEAGDLGLRFWLRDRLPLETETAFFILVNVLDIALTVVLLYGGGHREANPIAEYFLNHWGLKGMALYKLSTVAVVCVIAQIVARHSLSAGRRLLYVVTAIVAAVVVYSLSLLLHGH